MIKKVVIAGSRYFNDYKIAKEFIDKCLSNIRKNNEIVILSGGCKGADMLGERYAKENGFKIERFPAEWDKYGLAAGPKRNEKMAKECDYVICFYNGSSRGTKSMITEAQKHGKETRIKRVVTKE